MPLILHGTSDDNFDLFGGFHLGEDRWEVRSDVVREIGAYDRHMIVEIGDQQGGLRVICAYAPMPEPKAVWRYSVEYLDDGVPLPWQVLVRPHVEQYGSRRVHPYSPEVVIDCPDGTPFTVRSERK